jgi:hypothetical protein
MARNHYDSVQTLEKLGIAYEDAVSLRRISMTLHRWHELECGTDRGCIEREGENGDGRPFMTYERGNGTRGRYRIADREKGAHKRLAKIMARYPALKSYIQGDPRGAALYILRPDDVPEGQQADAYYSRGIVVCR